MAILIVLLVNLIKIKELLIFANIRVSEWVRVRVKLAGSQHSENAIEQMNENFNFMGK